MDATTATAFVTANKGQTIVITLHDATTSQVGEALSVNSKGVNIKVDGKVRSFSLKRVASLSTPAPVIDPTAGYTTAEVAEMFDMSAKELRVHLRSLGLGVGKGRKYGLGPADVTAIRNHLTNA